MFTDGAILESVPAALVHNHYSAVLSVPLSHQPTQHRLPSPAPDSARIRLSVVTIGNGACVDVPT